MEAAWVVGLKAFNGGLFVVGFALIAELLEPKRFAGLFSAAPSIALANLLVVAVAQGEPDVSANLSGMVVGAVAMALAFMGGVFVSRRVGSLPTSAVICALWGAFALAGWAMLP